MLYFLFGADSYRSRKKLEEMVARYKELREGGLSLLRIDAAKADADEFFVALRAVSLFSAKKLAVIKNLFAAKDFQERFLDEMESVVRLPDIVAVYESDAPDSRTKLFRALQKAAACQEFKPLDARQTRQWAQAEFQKAGQKVNLDALDLLVRSTGSDLWRLAGEIQKLCHYKRGETVRREDVALLVKPRIETDIFKTIDRLAERDKGGALELLQKHLETGESPLYLMSMVAYQFRNLLVVKELAEQGLMPNSIARRAGLHPFVAQKNYAAARRFSFDELKRIYRLIFDIDSKIKRGEVDQETGLGLLVSSI